MLNSFVAEAPCKINLHLRILDRREDSFHNLESIFLALSFGDTLHFELPDGGGKGQTEVLMAGDIPPEQNLINKAVDEFRVETGFKTPLRIRVEKRIPVGAGLGGGSSDAAAVLTGLSFLSGIIIPPDRLFEMALRLGSDVPFFLYPSAAVVSGRGDHIRRIKSPERIWVMLVNPGFPSNTGAAYGLFDQKRQPVSANRNAGDLINALYGDPARWPFRNDFLELFLEHGSKEEREGYTGILRDLNSAGAVFTGLSGSGSTCFGIFLDKGVAEKAKKELSLRWNFVQLTFPLARSADTVLQ